MRRFVKYGLLSIVAMLAVASVGMERTRAAEVNTWVGKPAVKVTDIISSPPPEYSESCSGTMTLVMVEGDVVHRSACVYGDSQGVRIARYYDGGSGFIYAIAFAGDDRFIDIHGLCANMRWCAYAQSEDVFLMQVMINNGHAYSHVVVKDFTKHLVLRSGFTRYYDFVYDEPYRYVTSWGYPTKSIAVSPGGRWAVVELPILGFLRIDLRTMASKRVIAPGATYGVSTDPTFEISITDDGRQVAVTGWRAGIDIYEITDGCGDALTPSSPAQFPPGTRQCERGGVDWYELFPGFRMGQVPRFLGDGTALSVYIHTLWGVQKTTLAPESPHPYADGRRYIALGDSFTSGEGELGDAFYAPGTNTDANRCHVSIRSYPFLLGVSRGMQTHNAACSGSRTQEVRDASITIARDNDMRSPGVISLGVGGNDVDLMGKLKTCIMPGTCEWVRTEKRAATAREIRALFPRVVELIDDIKTTYPHAKLFFVGYPSVINDTADGTCGPLLSQLLTAEEKVYMNQSITYLNAVLRAAAQYSKVKFVDIEGALVGERLCDDTQVAMNAIRLGDDIAPLSFLQDMKIFGAESFHPTPRGHGRIASAILNNIEDFWGSSECDDCHYEEALLKLGPYWNEGGGTPPDSRQIAHRFLQAAEFTTKTRTSFMLPAQTFLPGASLRVELHSEPLLLGEFLAQDDGSITGDIGVPEVGPGYHTVHIFGQGYSGDAIDVYQTVYIGDTRANEQLGGEVLGDKTTTSGRPVTSGASKGSNLAMATPQIVTEKSTETSSLASIPTLKMESVLGEHSSEDVMVSSPPVHTDNNPIWILVIVSIGLAASVTVGVILWLKRRQTIPKRE